MRTDRAKHALGASHAAWLAATLATTLLPHTEYLPLWLTALCAVLIGWRLAADRGASRLPKRWLLLLVAALVVAGIALHFRHFLGKDPGLALLAGLACLKLLESRQVGDGRKLVLLCFFLQLGQFLNGQEIAVALLTAAGTLLALGSLQSLESDTPPRTALQRSATLVLQAAPFMLLLFVLFPRIQGPLWGLPADAYSGLTGLSDSMTPGSISRLIQSGEIAFRAEFEGAPPPPRLRYWRGPILSDYDGATWRPAPVTMSTEPPYRTQGRGYAYRLTLEPNNQPWLLALDYAAGPLPQVRFTREFQLLWTSPLRNRLRLDLSSFPDTQVGVDDPPRLLARNQLLPNQYNPRLRALGARIQRDSDDPAGRIEALIGAFRAQNLGYTLNTPALGEHPDDAFFFDTRRGFCEHFASAFAVAARAAGLPARVVTGYQGGELNPLDGSLVVRQSDAHAWVEVWLESRGWLRVDPTAASHPRRIDDGIAGAIPEPGLLPFFMQPQLSWLRAIRYRWEALSNTWNQAVLGYNPERQQSLLKRLGLESADWQSMVSVLAALTGTLMLAYLAWALMRGKRRDLLDRGWELFCDKLARAGSRRESWQGPLDFARQAAGRHVPQAEVILDIARRYAELRYGRARRSGTAARELLNDIRRFRPE